MNIRESLDFYRKVVAPHRATLIAVSKNHPVDSIKEAYDLGQRVFGENRVQELLEKYEQLPKDIEWHLIGHLQKNKVKYIAGFVTLIHSIDSFELLKEVDKQSAKLGKKVSCLLQVHIAEEESKFGFSKDELITLLSSKEIQKLQNVEILGLMGMATFSDDENKIANEFKGLKDLFEECKSQFEGDNIHMKELSIGMSSDCELALRQGSTMIRVGTAIFGKR